ncbi:unnamed protein product [Cylindrotheca closterium]|uniref:Uncharacterized protein n=1 Tax=Cylindrotheca closterium TaxID=2856 RepID=A0AAD2FM28_9STRA|nr:unnamed protein product [Cylindrotheca closterium]
MKLSITSSVLVALAGMGSLIPAVAAIDFTADVTFKSENEIVDTPESLAILQDALIMASDASHDPDVFHLESDEIVSSSHTLVKEGGRKLIFDDDFDSGNFWFYANFYRSFTSARCNGCRRRLGAGPATFEDDAVSHAKWEASLCEILAKTDAYAGVSDCVISFAAPAVAAVAKEAKDTAEFLIDISFNSNGQVYDSKASLKAIEKALLKAAGASHDPDTFHLESDEIVSSSHTLIEKEGGRKLLFDDDFDSGNFWFYANFYRSFTSARCNGCRRRLGAGPATIEDDAESHAKWEAAFCELLNGIKGYEGATDCVITLVEDESA